MNKMLSLLPLVALITFVPASSEVKTHDRGFDYARVRNSLKIADMLMLVNDDTGIGPAVSAAEADLREAIRLIDSAAVIDRNDINENPPIPQYWDPQSRHLAIYRLLAGAKRDLSSKGSLVAAAWLKPAVDRIDRAMHPVKLIVRNDFRYIDSLQRYLQITSPTLASDSTGPRL